MTIDELVTRTRTEANSVDPLDLLTAAARQQQGLTELGDELLDYWVQHARAAGCSWARIGGALGVSKQAVQQRHSLRRDLLGKLKGAARSKSVSPHLFNRFTPRARDVVVHAQQEARQLRHNYIGTEHLLLGLLAEGEGVAGRALDSAGVSLESARAAVEEIIGCAERAPSGHIPFTPRAKRVLELSLREAVDLGHDYIGTEHVLLGILREGEGVAMQIVIACGVQGAELRDAVLAQRAR
ncbi:MAG: hypothetical protein GEU83_09125 [Pseudonocardiaceae bacterium]|nr:hypothetical protein [Pseudonocardiaceae bacterium]